MVIRCYNLTCKMVGLDRRGIHFKDHIITSSMMKTSYQLSGGIRTVWVLLGGYTTTCDCRNFVFDYQYPGSPTSDYI